MPNFNIEDPAVQEKIRRGSHEYVPSEGRHGRYVERPYVHREYPKVVGYQDEAKTVPIIVRDAQEERNFNKRSS